LNACIVTPAAPKARHGNRVTALRWGKRLRELGWRVRLARTWQGEPCDVLVAIHAIRSHASIVRHAVRCPTRPRVVALAGTDLYGDDFGGVEARASVAAATRLVVLQPEALESLTAAERHKARVIGQSASAPVEPLRVAPPSELMVTAIGHLREVKDPLLAARALALLPAATRVHVFHLGAALDEVWRARAEEAASASRGRWTWLGDRARAETLRILAASDLFVLTSLHEGGANVVTEAIACGVPILSTAIDGSLGILGRDHEGYFPVGDAAALSALLRRAELEPAFLETLREKSVSLKPLVDPARERAAWASLLTEIVG
jgi:putative glycosyltransferase (TIGR04348 family)